MPIQDHPNEEPNRRGVMRRAFFSEAFELHRPDADCHRAQQGLRAAEWEDKFATAWNGSLVSTKAERVDTNCSLTRSHSPARLALEA